ncbi:MAG: hypothetical protein JNL10_08325 [Verrucomicrobiales bacterium]|nr:hypothetical protein [Verrucomicrobiales bacterium]
MNRFRWFSLLGGLVLIAAAVMLGRQRSQLTALRAEWESRRTGETSESGAGSSSPGKGPSPGVAWTEEENRELLSLRRDVGLLRRQKADWERVEREHLRWLAAVNAGTNASPGGAEYRAYIGAGRARFVGMGSPAETLESFLAAVRSRDTNALFQLLEPQFATGLRQGIEVQGVEAMLRELGTIPGFQIRSQVEKPGGTVDVIVSFDPRPGGLEETLEFRPVNGQWRMPGL